MAFRQLIGILLADQSLRSGFHQPAMVAVDGEAGDAQNRQMPVHETDPMADGRPLQALHGHVQYKQVEIVVVPLATFDRFVAGSGRPHHVGRGDLRFDEKAQRFQRARIVVDQRYTVDFWYGSCGFRGIHRMAHFPHSQ